uniref:Putative secreted protein n=1 Tax=Anopheles darlingi TaxID=43151 RepID=A0A2M4DDE6_ANODA
MRALLACLLIAWAASLEHCHWHTESRFERTAARNIALTVCTQEAGGMLYLSEVEVAKPNCSRRSGNQRSK